jgi:DNA-directed RNA polymerase subunit L
MNQILSYIPKQVQNDILKLISNTKENNEFEFIFFSKNRFELNKKKYVMLLKFLKAISKGKLEYGKDLDINMNIDERTNYRVTTSGEKNINRSLKRLSEIQNKNYLIYKFLLQSVRKPKNDIYDFIEKKKLETIELDDINCRIRLSSEIDLKDNVRDNISKLDKKAIALLKKNSEKNELDLNMRSEIDKSIVFRLKERTSAFIVNNDKYFIRVDLTDTKTSNNRGKLLNVPSNYELEIEFGIKSKLSQSDYSDAINKIYDMSETILRVLQQSKFIISKSRSNEVINYYKDIMAITTPITKLVGRKAVSLEIQHLSEILPNKYAVTDKADGDRYFLIIYNNGVYLVAYSNLNVKDTGIVLDKKLKEYNGSVMDGELIYLPKKRSHVFMAFDCLRKGSEDLRNIESFMDRLKNCDEIIDNCFVFNGQLGFEHKEIPVMKEFDENKVSEFYKGELKKFYDNLDSDLNESKEYPLIRRKYFMSVNGAKNWEIFKYSSTYWNAYTQDSNINVPYELDGLIYHPLIQSYETNSKESKMSEYKWKPPSKNSIDIYIKFRRDYDTNEILRVYDNTDSVERNRYYSICNLYVGKAVRGKEQPILFERNNDTSQCYIFEDDMDHILKDEEGNIISDKTVVEFYYVNDPNIIPQKRWIPIRTRYDKTESVERYEKEYGNYYTIADKVWRSIINPVSMSDIEELAKGNTKDGDFYGDMIKKINSRVDNKLIIESNREKKYYQKKTDLASSMRQFHNAIKSNLIYTYYNRVFNNDVSKSIFDIACGRGGDISKFYYVNPDFYVGIDIDEHGLKSPDDGAISRYNNSRKRRPDFPKMHFIQADARALLNYESQKNVLSGMDSKNENLIKKFFPHSPNEENVKYKTFDVINCQFAVHYFFKDDNSWNNFKQNINNHLRAGGYFVCTNFDAKQVIDSIADKESFKEYYTDKEGNKNLFFDVTKKYGNLDTNKPIGTGKAIDLYASWIFEEGNYVTEYLVDYNFFKKEMEELGFELVESDLFQNQYVLFEKFFTDSYKFESKKDTMKFFKNVSRYFEDNEMNKISRKYTNLHRYYVFRKKDSDKINKQKGGKYDFGSKDFILPKLTDYDSNYSFVNSIHRILTSHGIIPKSISVEEFAKEYDVDMKKDSKINSKFIKKLGSKLEINHDIEGKIRNVMDGLNFYIVERDCNNHYDIDCYHSKSNTKSMIMMREGDSYRPIMKVQNKKRKGIFKNSDKLIDYLNENGKFN